MAFLDLLMIYRLQLACICFTFLVAIPFFAIQRVKNFANKLFNWLLIFQLLSLIGDVITVYTVNNLDTVPEIINNLFHKFFIAALFIFIYITFLYIRYQVTADESKTKILIYGAPVALSLLALVFINIDYEVTGRGNYSSGPGVDAIFAILGIYLVAMLFLLIRFRSKINSEKRRVLLIALITEVFVSGIQLFIPYILISSLGTTIIVVAIFLTIENPDRILRDMYHKAYSKIKAQNRIIVESIEYASKIQKNLLPPADVTKDAFSDFAVIWQPRDVVGGDIYWLRRFDKGTVLCVADCTGHGTPGALLTMLVVSALESIVRTHNCDDTSDIVRLLDKRLSDALHVHAEERGSRRITDIDDGCDLAVFFVGTDGSVRFSSGNMPVFVCDGVDVTQYKGQKIFVGEGRLESKDGVETIVIPPNPDNKFYVASDGFFDQKGGEHGWQFGYKTVKEILLTRHNESLTAITDNIWSTFEEYSGKQVRRDDLELVAFKP